MSLKPGDVLGGKYEVERVLGEGGMGLVVAARHRELGHRVAVKCLHASALGNEGAVLRFEREARAAAALTSEHVARVIDVERLEDGSPYMVMELLEGEDLQTMLQREGALGIVDTIRFASHAAEGLAEAHAAGIVHRDVKPSNLFVTRRKKGAPVVKVLDFGIAKNVSDAADRNLTATQALLGSPQYMSPEQVRESKSLDARTDVWALGVTMYECLAGKKPFDAPSMVDLCFAIVHADPPSLYAVRPDVPPKLEAVILKCLAKNVDERYATMAELQDDLMLILSHVSGEVSTASLRFAQARSEALSQRVPDAFAATTAGTARVGTGSLDGVEGASRPPSSSAARGRLTLLLASVGTFLALGAFALALRPREPLPPPSPGSVAPPAAPAIAAPPPAPPAPSNGGAAEPLEAIAPAAAAPVPAAEPPKPAPPKGPAKAARKGPASAKSDDPPAKSKGLHMTIE
jgi:serine/threonine-protein kinase